MSYELEKIILFITLLQGIAVLAYLLVNILLYIGLPIFCWTYEKLLSLLK